MPSVFSKLVNQKLFEGTETTLMAALELRKGKVWQEDDKEFGFRAGEGGGVRS